MIYEFKEFDGVNQTPAIDLIARAWPEMLAQGIAPREGIHNWDHQAIVAFAGELPVGLMTYTHEKWRRLLWVHLGYVVPELRRQGVYRMLWERVVKAGQKLGAAEIQGATSVSNIVMLDCARKLGRTNMAIITRFAVPAAPPVMVPAVKAKAKKR